MPPQAATPRLTGLMSVTERRSRSKGDGTTMSAGRRILLALRDPWLAAALRDALFHAPEFQLTGIIDPTIDRTFSGWHAYADILLIGADELLWLQRSGSCGSITASAAMRVIVLLDESRILDLFHQIDHPFGLVLDIEDGRFLAERIDLAAAGYVVFSGSLLIGWVSNHLRRRLVDDLSPNERRILACVGRALSNKGIAAETGFPESEVKKLVQSVMRKLRMKTRTAVAVFAATVLSTGIDSAG
jgi:DNA-binding NarL/FixJ family response regulator